MADWCRRIQNRARLTTNGVVCCTGPLRSGHTVPLQHPPLGLQHRAPPTLSPCVRPTAVLPFSVSACSLSHNGHLVPGRPREAATSSDTSARLSGNSAREKKRWQTANYRWMFTRRNSKFCLSFCLNVRIGLEQEAMKT